MAWVWPIYSDLQLESISVGWHLNDQLIALPLKLKTKPDVECFIS